MISISALLAEPVSKAKSTLFLLLIFNINIYSIYSLVSDFGKGGFTFTSGFWFVFIFWASHLRDIVKATKGNSYVFKFYTIIGIFRYSCREIV